MHLQAELSPPRQWRACPMCGSEESLPVRKLPDHQGDEEFDLDQCADCSGLFINPVPERACMERYYEEHGGAMMRSEGNPLFVKLRNYVIGMELRPLLARLGPDQVVADLGTGDGQIASYLHKRGHRVMACDSYEESGWKISGIPYRQFDLNSECSEPIEAEAVIIRHVLEHVHDPVAVLDWLRRSGVRYVFLVVPNVETSFARLFGKSWYYWDPPRHLSFFSARTLQRVAERCGYRQVSATDHGIDEVITSLYRRQMIRWSRTADRSSAAPWWYDVLKPKGLAAALSSVVSAPFGRTALCRLFELSGSPAQ